MGNQVLKPVLAGMPKPLKDGVGAGHWETSRGPYVPLGNGKERAKRHKTGSRWTLETKQKAGMEFTVETVAIFVPEVRIPTMA